MKMRTVIIKGLVWKKLLENLRHSEKDWKQRQEDYNSQVRYYISVATKHATYNTEPVMESTREFCCSENPMDTATKKKEDALLMNYIIGTPVVLCAATEDCNNMIEGAVEEVKCTQLPRIVLQVDYGLTAHQEFGEELQDMKIEDLQMESASVAVEDELFNSRELSNSSK